MALGDANNRLAPVNPAALIGSGAPVVEPRAVAALSDAFRSGFITADDIMQRAGEAGQLRQKAEVQLLSEQVSPEAIAARAAQRDAAAAQAGLQSATATAQTPLAAPAGQLAATQIEEQQAVQKYGPGVEYFKALAPEAGVQAPVTSEGAPDYGKRAQLGLQLFEWKQRKEQAKARLTPDPKLTKDSPDGSNVFFFNSQGERIEDLKPILTAQATAPFSQVAPGTVAQPQPVNAPTATVQSAMQTSDLVERDRQLSALLPGALPTVEPRIAAPTEIVVEPGLMTGASAYLGPPKERTPTTQTSPSEQAIALNENQNDLTAIARARNIISSGNVVGPGIGSAPVRTVTQIGAALGISPNLYQSQDELVQLINKRVLEGAQKLKGNLSDKDIRFLQASFPSLQSAEPVWNNFLNRWEQMLNLNDQVIRGTAPKGASVFDTAIQNVAPSKTATTTPGASGEVINFPSTGRRMIIDSNGLFRLVK